MTKETVSLTISTKSAFSHVLFNLAAQGFSHIRIDYSGGGDSGAIDSIELLERGTVEEGENGEILDVVREDFRYVPDPELEAVIENQVFEQVLEDADDWYNNEGGGGTLFISCDNGDYYCDHYINIMTQETSVLTGQFGD